MANTKHTATLDGQTFTRTSKTRVYTHCIVGKPRYSRDMALSQAYAKTIRSNWEYYTKIVAAGGNVHMTRWSLETSDEFIDRLDANAAAAAAELGGRTQDQYVADARQAQLDYIEAARVAGYYDTWKVISWSSRHDLANKAARAALRYYACSEIVPARTS